MEVDKIKEGMYENLIDAEYKKIIYVKTCGKTITAKVSPQHTVDSMKKQVEEKTRIPKDQQHLVSRGRVQMDRKKIEDYDMNVKETIAMTVMLLGGTRRDEYSPSSKTEGREEKRKASEPCIGVSGLEENGSTSASSEGKMERMMRCIGETMKEIKHRTGDISQFEQSMSSVSNEMTEMRTMGRMSETCSQMNAENQIRDPHFAQVLAQINVDLRNRERRTDERITNLEKSVDDKIEEKINTTIKEKTLRFGSKDGHSGKKKLMKQY